MQVHTIILWQKPISDRTSFDDIVRNVIDILTVFNALPEQYRPNFYTSNSKASAKPFVLDYDEISSHLQKTACTFKDSVINYSIGLFSSKNNDSAFGYSLRVGTRENKHGFINTLVVNIAINYDIYDEKYAGLLEKVFKECVSVFNPFWGAIVNDSARAEDTLLVVDGTPANIHWINYWSDDIIDQIGLRKIKKAKKKYEQFNFDNGIIKIQNLPINAENPKEIEYRSEIEKHLFKKSVFSRLARKTLGGR